MPLTDFLRVTLNIEQAPILAAGFGKPLITGTHSRFVDLYQEYTSLADMLAAGFLTSDAEYAAASALLAQPVRVPLFAVGRRGTPVAQVIRVDVTGTTDGNYSITINGRTTVPFAAVGQTATQIRDALITATNNLAAAQADVNVLAAIFDADSLTITALNAGESFTYSVSAPGAPNLTAVQTVANVGLQQDLAAIAAAGLSWYGNIITDRDRWDILEAAAWIESAEFPHLFIPQASEAASRDTTYDAVNGTDLATILRARDYMRTGLLWHDDDAERADAAWMGRMLPRTPGTEMWGMATLTGITPAALTTSERNNLVGATVGTGKNANVYYAVTNTRSHTWRGQVASGEWIDLVRYADFLQADIATRVANLLLSLADQGKKIPMTDGGIQSIVAQVAGSLGNEKAEGRLASYEITAPRASQISQADRTARRLNPPITFTALTSGAIQEIEIQGTITQ